MENKLGVYFDRGVLIIRKIWEWFNFSDKGPAVPQGPRAQRKLVAAVSGSTSASFDMFINYCMSHSAAVKRIKSRRR